MGDAHFLIAYSVQEEDELKSSPGLGYEVNRTRPEFIVAYSK